MKLSIIVPVYNTQKYIDECVDSIVHQTYKDFELILVDDGSSDSSGHLCDKWAERDSRILVLHKKNEGLMSAWKYGVTHAKGEYIGFVDSDDWIDKDMYETMLSYVERKKCDLVCAAFIKNFDDGSESFEPTYLTEGFYKKDEIIKSFSPRLFISKEIHNRLISANRVTKVYRREKLLRILDDCYDNVSIGEDLVTTFNYLQICDSLYFIGDYYPYHYRINSDSMIQKFNKNKYEEIKNLRRCLLDNNEKYKNYDFKNQINADFINLIMKNMECHILYSNSKSIKQELLAIWLDPSVQKAKEGLQCRLLCLKERLYLFLLRKQMIGILIFIRRLKKWR